LSYASLAPSMFIRASANAANPPIGRQRKGLLTSGWPAKLRNHSRL